MHLGGERERHLTAADQLEIDLGQDLAVEQRAVQRAARIVDAVVLAERIEADARAGVAVARNLDRVDHLVGERGQLRLLELEIQKADIERRVVRDDRRVADEAEELARDLAELRLVAEERVGEAVHLEGDRRPSPARG